MSKKVQIDSKSLEATLRQKLSQIKIEIKPQQYSGGAVESPVKSDQIKFEQAIEQQLSADPNGAQPKTKRKESQGYIGNLRSSNST